LTASFLIDPKKLKLFPSEDALCLGAFVAIYSLSNPTDTYILSIVVPLGQRGFFSDKRAKIGYIWLTKCKFG